MLRPAKCFGVLLFAFVSFRSLDVFKALGKISHYAALREAEALSKTYQRAPALFSGQGMRLLGEMELWRKLHVRAGDLPQ